MSKDDDSELPLKDVWGRIREARKTMDEDERGLHRVAIAHGYRDVACQKCPIVFLAMNKPIPCGEEGCPFARDPRVNPVGPE